MVTKIGGKRRAHLYIEEWQAFRSRSDQNIADRLETSRTTIWRWRNQQHRLDLDKIAALAWALDCEPEDLWRLPSRPSLDAIVASSPDDDVKMAADVVRRILSERKAS